ncbi:MAG: nucleotidyltransferase family protein [Mycobacteriales bacterium]|nr:MAG: DNA polymerase subunit beta [Pseudonocardiales bacterium]
MPLADDELRELAGRLAAVPGVVGVSLGGSRARDDHAPDSDVDLGVYYRPPLDVTGLRALARAVAGPDARVTSPGDWGPWVDGGGWLSIGDTAVDWIYRDLDRVRAAWADAQRGRFRFHVQTGHPLGVPDFAYAGEVALGRVLADPSGELTALKAQTADYPPELAEALVDGLGEATFLIAGVRKAIGRGDTTWVAGCLFRVIGACTHALHGRAGRWLINEKGAVASAGRLGIAPVGFEARAHAIMAALGTSAADLSAAVDSAADLVRDTAAACARHR